MKPTRPMGSGRSFTTPEARLVTKHAVRAPVRAVARVDVDAEYGWTTKVLTCGHASSGKSRKDGRYACYDCQVETAHRLESA